jgi:hypothetical protein
MSMTDSYKATAVRTAATATSQVVSTVVTVSTIDARVPADMPASLPADEIYYWTAKWQADEAESRRELDAGQGRTFESSADAIRWLLDPTTE